MGKASQPFLYGVPKGVLIQTLRSESAKQGYSDTGARVSLFLDIDAGKPRARGEYAKIWGWTPYALRTRWEGVIYDVAMWATSYGRQKATPLGKRAVAYVAEDWQRSEAMRMLRTEAAREAHDVRTENSPNDTTRADLSHDVRTEAARWRHDILDIPTSLHPPSSKDNPPPRGREGGGSKDDVEPLGKAPPRNTDRADFREAVLAYFEELGGSHDLAERWLDHHDANGWRTNQGPMKDWRATIRTWVKNETKYGRTQQSPRSRPAANGSRRNGSGLGDDPAADLDRNRRAARAALGL